MKKPWQPWIDFDQDQESLPIEGPPCRECVHWHPLRVYGEHGEFEGVRLCHAPKGQSLDFSCYKPPPENKLPEAKP